MTTQIHSFQCDVNHAIVSRLARKGPQALADLAKGLGVAVPELEPRMVLLAQQGWVECEVPDVWQLRQKAHFLDAGIIASNLDVALPVPVNVEAVLETGSTNDDLLARARTGSVHGVALLAEGQTLGRGRRGRSWVSPLASNLYLSLAWQLTPGPSGPGGLSLAVGCALAQALERYSEVPLQLKWPNDLYIENKKLGGILIDIAGDPLSECKVVVGFGLNVDMPLEKSSAIDQPWTDLTQHSQTSLDRNALAATCITALVEALVVFDEGGFDAFRSAWDRYDCLKGRSVEVLGSPPIKGVGAGVDETGALLVDIGSGLVPVHGGEVSVRDRGLDAL